MSSLWYPSVKQAPLSMGGMGGLVGSTTFAQGGPKYYSNDFDGTSELLLPWQNANLDFA